METIFKSFSPDLKHVFQKTDEIRLYFYNHSHGAEESVLGNLLLYLVHNNGTVRSSCRKKTLPGNRTCIHISISLVKFHEVSKFSYILLFYTSCNSFQFFSPCCSLFCTYAGPPQNVNFKSRPDAKFLNVWLRYDHHSVLDFQIP